MTGNENETSIDGIWSPRETIRMELLALSHAFMESLSSGCSYPREATLMRILSVSYPGHSMRRHLEIVEMEGRLS